MILFTLLSESEKELVTRMIPLIAAGDEQALTAVYNTVGGRLLSLAMGITRDLHLAEDVISESFLKLIRYADKFKGGSGYAWLAKIVKNTALNMIKSGRYGRQGADIDEFFSLSDGKNYVENSVNAVAVETALKKLSAQERLCIWLKYFNDYTVREIAAEVNLAKSTVQEIIKKAEQKLREFME